MRIAAAYLGALPVTETNCVTKPFQPENCPNCHPTKICGLHSIEGIEAFVCVVRIFMDQTLFEGGFGMLRFTLASMASLLYSPQILVGWQLGQFSGWKGCVTQILSLAGNAPK